MKMAMIYIFVGALATGIGVLCWMLFKKKPGTYTPKPTPKEQEALNKEIEAIEAKVIANVTASEKRKVLAEIKALKDAADQTERLRRLAELAKGL